MIAILNDPPRHVCECGCGLVLGAKLAEAERKHGALIETILGLRAEVAQLQAEMIFDEENETRIVTALEAEVERLKLSMLAHFNEEHLAGDGPEIDRWKAEVKLWQGRSTTSARDAATYEAEVERLREAQHQAVIGWDAEREKSERLRGLLAEWIPRHSAACCTPTPELGSFPPGPFLPKWCKCDSLSKRSRAALAPEVKP